MAYLEADALGYGAGNLNRTAPVCETNKTGFAAFGGKATHHDSHTVIYYEGDPAKRLYELVKGTVMLYKLLPDGRRQVVEVLQSGDIFGLSSGSENDCTAETLVEAEVSEIDLKQVEASADLQRLLTKCLTNQMHVLHEHAVLLGRKSAVERVASFLMHLVPERGGPGCPGPRGEADDGFDLQLHMTRQEIADYLGLTIETVSRVVSDLKRRGIIRVDRADKIHLNKVCGLCQMTGMH
ncbi:cyclic nucleotide-binding domain-containing protein [Roseibium denhamense]|uniref:CRP/FNR family transcriptional regulator, anaerobic regulatory protein n=1 Tax=Roseibium denhamense TaxID=76305 RepID=A0ABY1P4Y8_9HYPH|nr:helix-turn-helix domain-containing protein [Roseibium denhamense]MTI07219.1 cyclic nucleotide-binding domain-containing protein [Roseibium denhamense]SMP26526.1 CRP/FNR family transcriptional regulator, anaerobic regulatory protein [Roseibium denhamense]